MINDLDQELKESVKGVVDPYMKPQVMMNGTTMKERAR